MSELRKKAVEAYGQRAQQNAEDQTKATLEEMERNRGLLRMLLERLAPSAARSGQIHISDDVKWGVIGSIEGEDLRFTLDKERYLTVLGPCPHCGTEVHSRFIRDEGDLGEMIVNFQPEPFHRCPGVEASGAVAFYLYCGACSERVLPVARGRDYFCPHCNLHL